jgi:hypothetical protein
MRFPSEWSRTREIRRARHRMSLSKSCVLFIALMETASRRSELDRTGAVQSREKKVSLLEPDMALPFPDPGQKHFR